MARALFVSIVPGELRAMISEDDEPVALALERDTQASLVGAIFLGRVVRAVPSLPGAFIELGLGRPAFLPLRRENAVLPVEGAALAVQVVKDAHDDKAPEVTDALSLDGRLAVWTPGRPGLAVSRKLPPDERARLSAMAAPLLTATEGAVLRSHAIGAATNELRADFETLRADHAALVRRLAAARAPARIDAGPAPLVRLLTALGPSCERIVLDDRAAFAEARHVPGIAAERLVLDPGPRFAERHGIDAAFEAALDTIVPLPGGGRLTIESGRAFTQIDVDLGAASGGRARAGEAIRRLNLAAATVIAQQLRLRNIGGAVVVDFVAMQNRGHRQEVEAAFAASLADDPAGVETLGWTRLGHFELTRRRTSPSLADLVLEPTGQRRRKTAATIAFELLRALAGIGYAPGGIEVRLHPAVASLLRQGLSRHLLAVADGLGRPVALAPDAARDPETFDIGRAEA